MRTSLIVTALALASAVAPARADESKDLGEGYSLSWDHGVTVHNGKRHAPLVAYGNADSIKIDAKARSVTFDVNSDCGSESQAFTFDQLEARLVNAEALAKHLQRDYRTAAKGFAATVKLDPKWKLAAYNLASAQTRLGDKRAAVSSLAPWLATEPVQTYAQIASDDDLQPLLGEPELVKLRAGKPGKTSLDKGSIFYSADKKLLAIEEELGSMDTPCGASDHLLVFEVPSGKQVASLEVRPGAATDPRCTQSKAQRAKADASFTADVAMANHVLADFAFAPVKPETSAFSHSSEEARATLAKAKLDVVAGEGDKVSVMRGTATLGEATGLLSRPHDAAYLAALHVVVVTSHEPSELCPQAKTTLVWIK